MGKICYTECYVNANIDYWDLIKGFKKNIFKNRFHTAG